MSVDFKELRFLLVDDSREMLSALRSALGTSGAKQFFEASNVPKGAELLRQQHIDVVLLNAELPGVDGLELVRWIRASKDAVIQDVSIILFSGSSDQETVQQAIKAGINGFVKKPVSADALHSRVVKALEAKGKGAPAEKKYSFLYGDYKSVAAPRS